MTPLEPGMAAWAIATLPATNPMVPTVTAATRALVILGRRGRVIRAMQISPHTESGERGFRLWLPVRPRATILPDGSSLRSGPAFRTRIDLRSRVTGCHWFPVRLHPDVAAPGRQNPSPQ